MIKEIVGKYGSVVFKCSTSVTTISFVNDVTDEIEFTSTIDPTTIFTTSKEDIFERYLDNGLDNIYFLIQYNGEEYDIYRRYETEYSGRLAYYIREWTEEHVVIDYSSYLRKEKLLKLI